MSSLHHKAWLSCAVRCGLLVTALGIGHSAFAQVPGMVSFQGVLKDGGGTPLSGPVTLDFRIFDSQSGTTGQVDMDGDGVVENTVGQDVKEIATMATNGVVSVAFGPVSPSVFNGQPRFIEVTIVNPGPATALARVPMTTAPAVAEQLYARGTTNVAVTTAANGNVGVGTTSPQARLHVNGESGILLQRPIGYPGHLASMNISSQGGPPGLRFELSDNGGSTFSDALFLAQGGHVGIGTTEPQSKLELFDQIPPNVRRPLLNLVGFFTDGDPQQGQSIDFRVNSSGPPEFPAAQIVQSLSSGAGGELSFFTSPNYSTTPPANRLTISANGNIGLGTSIPTAQLYISHQNLTSALVVDSGVDPAIAGPTVNIRNTTTTTAAVLRVEGDSDGDAGGPWDALVVQAGGVINGRFGLYHGPSDVRLKKDICTIPAALARVLALRGVTFRWRDPKIDGDELQMGLIAQEVEGIFPEVVHTADDEMRTKAIEYNGLIAAVIEATKDLQQEIDQLRSSDCAKDRIIDTQQKQIEELSGRLERVEKLLNELQDSGDRR